MMTNQENLRDIVCDILLEIERDQIPSHVAIRQMLEKFQYLDNRERRFISRLTRGTLERRVTLDGRTVLKGKSEKNEAGYPDNFTDVGLSDKIYGQRSGIRRMQ